MATSDMYKNSYTGKDNYIYLNDSTSPAKFPGASIYADGAVYTSDGSEWEATTVKPYTSEDLPNLASLVAGSVVNVDGNAAISGGDYLREVSRRTISNTVKTLRPFGRSESNAGILGYTGHLTLLSPVPFYAVRFKFVNVAAAAVINSKASFATPATNPTPCVTTAPWTAITVGGSATFSELAAPSATAATYTSSDIIPVTPVKRTDGDGYILMVRKYTPSAGNTLTSRVIGVGDASELADQLTGNLVQAGSWLGDAVTTPSSFARSIQDIAFPIYVELFTGDGIMRTMLYSGDSITQGQGGSASNNTQLGAAKRLCVERGIIPLCGAVAGAKSVDYVPQGLTYIADTSPTYAIVAPWSINDTDALTAGVEQRIMGNMVQWLGQCYKYNSTPGFITPAPKNGITLAEETVRRSVVLAIKTFCEENSIMCIDRDAALTDYSSSTGGYKAGLFTNALHPNRAGYSAELQLWEEVIQ